MAPRNTGLTHAGPDQPRYEDPLPDYAKAWVTQLSERYSHWPAGSVRAMVELYLQRPECFTPECIEAWKKTQLPDELKQPPREGVIFNIPIGTPEHDALEAEIEKTREAQKAEFVPALIEDKDEQQEEQPGPSV